MCREPRRHLAGIFADARGLGRKVRTVNEDLHASEFKSLVFSRDKVRLRIAIAIILPHLLMHDANVPLQRRRGCPQLPIFTM
jgi:hypothetical protein